MSLVSYILQIGNKHVVNGVSVTWKNTVGITPANRRVAPSPRAAGSICDRGVRVYWWKCGNWPSELQKKKSSAQDFTLYLLFFPLSVTHRFTAIKFSQRVLFLPQRCLKVLFTPSPNPLFFLFKYIDVEIEGGKKTQSTRILCAALEAKLEDEHGRFQIYTDYIWRNKLSKWKHPQSKSVYCASNRIVSLWRLCSRLPPLVTTSGECEEAHVTLSPKQLACFYFRKRHVTACVCVAAH